MGPEGVRGGGESNEHMLRSGKALNGSEGVRWGWSLKCQRLKHYIADRYKVRRSGGARGGQRGWGIE